MYVQYKKMIFEWDDQKAKQNIAKHGMSFEDARLVFFDPNRITFMDTRFDYGEERWITLGCFHDRVCVVVYTEIQDGDIIRIISARKANSRERKHYGDS